MITITIEGHDAEHVRREMSALLGEPQKIELAPMTWSVVDEPSARTVTEDPDTAVTEGAGDVRDEITAEPEQPRRGRGRPRKNPVTIDGESTLVSETTTPAEPEQIDLEDVLAVRAQETAYDDEPEADEQETAPVVEQSQPADPDKGWTHDDAKAVARQMYARLGSLQQHELDERLHNNLQKFGVQRIKDLALDKIEAFVRAVEGEVA